jgi:FkbM family methyltransferase
MSIKTLMKSVFHRGGIDIVRFVPELNRPFAVLPLLVRAHIATDEPFFFVQVGANDGVLDDPLRDLILQNRLPGLLIEPLPDIFDKLKHNYRDQPQLSFENVAILSCDGNVPIHRVRSNATVPHHWHGIASFNRGNLLTQGVPPESIETVSVEGTTLQFLLTKHKIEKVSLLQIDTEGYDFEIIRYAFDSGIFPDMINYEHCWLVPDIRYQCKQMLDRHGYQFLEVGKDTLAIRGG